jgi:hypothetical protein
MISCSWKWGQTVEEHIPPERLILLPHPVLCVFRAFLVAPTEQEALAVLHKTPLKAFHPEFRDIFTAYETQDGEEEAHVKSRTHLWQEAYHDWIFSRKNKNKRRTDIPKVRKHSYKTKTGSLP